MIYSACSLDEHQQTIRGKDIPLRKGTIAVILYVKKGFIIATDSTSTAEGCDPISVPKIFRITSKLGCVLTGIGHIQDTDTREEVWLRDSITESAKKLKAASFLDAVKQVSFDFHAAFLEAKERLKATFEHWPSSKLSELLFAGFDNGTALLHRVHFERIGEKLCAPLFEPSPLVLHEPIQYIRYGQKERLPLLISDRTRPAKLPRGFNVFQAEKLARKYVMAAIDSGDPTVGGDVQVAKIPRNGQFTFLTSPNR